VRSALTSAALAQLSRYTLFMPEQRHAVNKEIQKYRAISGG